MVPSAGFSSPLDHTIRSSLHPAALQSDSKAAKDKLMSVWSRAGSVCLASEKMSFGLQIVGFFFLFFFYTRDKSGGMQTH